MIKKLHVNVNRSLAFAALAIFMILPGLGWGQTNIIPKLYLVSKNTPSGNSGWTITSAAINNASTDYWKMLSGSSLESPAMNFSSYTSIQVVLSLASFGTISSHSDDIKVEYWNGTTWTQVGSNLHTTSTTGTQTVSLPYTYSLAKIRITAPNATSAVGARVFSIEITGTPANSTDATLSAMAISVGTLLPGFASATTAYTATVPYATSSITVTPTRNQANATIQARVNGGSYASVTSGSPSASLSLNAGTTNTVDVLVTAQDGTTTKTYTTTVTRTAAATISTLSNMVLSDGTLSPSFDLGTISYTASVPYTTSTITVTPTKTNTFASIQVQVNGGGYSAVTSGNPSSALSLTPGTTNTVDVKVTAEDGSFTTYTTTVTRAAIATDATLSALTTTAGALTPSFASGTTAYTASVDNATASVTVTPTKTNAFATIQVRVNSGSYAAVTSGSASGALALNEGNNTIDVKVTAQDASFQTYTITVNRAAASVPTISTVGTLSAVNTTYGSASATPTNFTISGSAMEAAITVTPPVGFQVSTTSDFSSNVGDNASPISVGAAGTINSTTIYVRLKATAPISGSPYSGDIVLTSSGATAVNVATVSSTVTQVQLTITGLTGVAKIYDATTTASFIGTASYSGLVNGESFSVSGTPSASFATATVGNPKTITITGYQAPTTNYTVADPTVTANITAKALTMSGLSVPASKPYDGTATAVVTDAKTLQTSEAAGAGNTSDGKPYTGDVVSITGTATGTYNDANVAGATTVTFGGLSLTGAQAENYSLTVQSPQAATITKANQTITGLAATDARNVGAANYDLTATAPGGAVTYASSNTSVASVAASTVTIGVAGSTTITASQGGSANYNAAPDVTQTLTVTLVPVVLAGWQFGTPASLGSEVTYDATTNNSNLNIATLSRGGGITATALARGFAANAWDANATKATAVSNGEFFQFTMIAKAGYNFSLSTLDATVRRSGATAPNAYIWKYSTDGTNFSEIGTDVSYTGTTEGVSQPQIVLSGIPALQNAKSITFRMYAWGGTSLTATYSIARYATGITTNCLAIGGNSFTDLTPPTLTADATANTVDNTIDITFTDDATWRGKITAVKIGTTTLTPTTDYAITAGNIQLKPSGANILLTVSGDKSVSVVASGYTDATVTQAINAGAPTANSTATIGSPLAPGTSQTITCTAKDQYNNLVSGYTFKYDATIVSADATITESYTLDGTAHTSTTNDINVATTTNASGVTTFTAVLPGTIDGSDGISLQVQLNNGTTNIGTAFAYHELPSQTITFAALDAVTYGDAPYTISATGGASGNPVVFTSSDAAVATCTGTNGTTITVIGPGTCTIHANQAGNGSYNAAPQVDRSLLVNTKALTIVSAAATGKVYDGNPTATISGTLSSLVGADVVTLTLSGTFADVNAANGISVTSTSTLGGADALKYTLTQPIGLTADITQATQSINGFTALYTRPVGTSPITLSATSTSGLTVSYASSDELVATVSGNILTIVGIGSTDITASQGGDVNHSAAADVIRTLVVTAVPVAAWDFTGAGGYTTLAATTFSSNLVSASSASEITRGSTAPSSAAVNSFRTTGFKNEGISTANTDYFQVTLSPAAGKLVSLSTIDANFEGTAGFYVSPGVTSQFAYSLDGTNFTLIGSPVASTSLILSPVDLSAVSALQDVLSGNTITLRYYASGQTTTGGWGFYSPSAGVNGLSIAGTTAVISSPTITSFTPDNVCAGSGTTVTITGTFLTGASAVTFNGTAAATYTVVNATTITAQTPAGVSTGFIAVTTPGGTVTSGGNFTVNPLPVSAGTISGSARVCQGAAAVSYSVPAITNATSYHWAYSGTGATITGSTNSVSIAFASNATAGNLTVYGINTCGNGIISANYAVAIDLVPFAFAGPTEVGTSGTPFTLSGAIATNGTILWTENGAGTITDNTVINPLYSAADEPIATVTFTLTVHNASCPDAVATKILYLTPSAIVLTWTGAASSTNWHDKNNWSDQAEIPGDGTNVTIPTGLSYYPTITAAALCNNITVESGASLIDNRNLTLSSGAKIIVKHPAISSGKWHLVSSPVANATSGMFLGNYLYNFISSSNSYTPVLSTGLALTAMKGYALYPKSSAFSVAYVGDLNKAPIYSITTTAAGGSGLGWNLVGNPYPSAIDWDAAGGWVKTGLVSGAIYINNGAVWSSYTQQVGTNLGSRYIAPTQGFFVKGNGGTFSMTDAVRVHNTVSFVKRAEEVVPNLVRLQVSGNGYKDEAVVRFFAGATSEMDRDYDAEKLYGDVPAAAQLYTLGSNPLAINTLPSIDNVGVGIKLGVKGSYTIAATEINDLGNTTLEDTELGISTDLSAGPYTFDAVAGTFDQRFILHFTMLGLTPTKNVEAAIYSYQRTVHINMKDQVKGDIFIYNISGQQVASKLAAQGMNEIKLTGTGNYIVKVISKNSTTVRKVFILQ